MESYLSTFGVFLWLIFALLFFNKILNWLLGKDLENKGKDFTRSFLFAIFFTFFEGYELLAFVSLFCLIDLVFVREFYEYNFSAKKKKRWKSFKLESHKKLAKGDFRAMEEEIIFDENWVVYKSEFRIPDCLKIKRKKKK